ncbi:MAG: MerR family transcriptional regulator [Coriobacteriia bacterium]|nr:MerR family transcriptional regulator [Coriobacteriia bacterium]
MTYTVGEASKILGVPASTLRYYESEGLLPTLGRSEGGQRLFGEQELEACRVIGCLKQSGLSIKDIKRFMDMVARGDESLAERLALFQERREALRAQIREMKQVEDVLSFKCWYYETALAAGDESAVRDVPLDQIPPELREAAERLRGEL